MWYRRYAIDEGRYEEVTVDRLQVRLRTWYISSGKQVNPHYRMIFKAGGLDFK